MIDKQTIIDDQKKTIHRLQQECTEKTNTILALGDKLKCKEQECESLNADNIYLRDRESKLELAILRRDEKLDQLKEQLKTKEQECETLASQLDFEVQKKECLEKKCKQQSWNIGNLGYKIKNQRHEINNRLKQLDQLKQECKELRVENKKLKEELLDLKLQFEEEQLMYEI